MMPKCWKILAVFLVVAHAGFPTPRIAADPKTGPGAEKAQDTQTQQPASSGSVAAPQSSYSTTFNDNADEKTGKDGWDKATVLADYLLVAVGIGGIFSAICTLRVLARQTKFMAIQTAATKHAAKATADAANAAYGSVAFAEAQFELMKEERRARISIKAKGIQVQDPDSVFWNLATSIEIRNLGQTRAFIKRTGGTFVVRADGEEHPQEDDPSSLYLSEEYIDPSSTPVVAALHWFNLEPASLKELGDDLHAHKRMLYLYGFIEYETLGMKFTEEFKYFWMARSFMEMFGGEETTPTDAEKIEEGHWWDNRSQSDDD